MLLPAYEKRIDVLDDGYVQYVDHMGDDTAIAEAARVTSGSKGAEDRNLIRYLMRHRHTTPIEMCELKIKYRCPMDIWRQIIRHRTASVNEFSTRYSEAIDSAMKTPPDKWRLQSKSNRQGSSGEFIPHDTPDDAPVGSYGGRILTEMEEEFHRQARRVYETRLASGVAKEQARKDLPLSTYTEAYWKIDLHNLLHFLSLRMDSHAQWETRQFANAIAEIVKDLWPITWEAFVDYRLEAITLTRLEIEWLLQSKLSLHRGPPPNTASNLKGREWDEFYAKLQKLFHLIEITPEQ